MLQMLMQAAPDEFETNEPELMLHGVNSAHLSGPPEMRAAAALAIGKLTSRRKHLHQVLNAPRRRFPQRVMCFAADFGPAMRFEPRRQSKLILPLDLNEDPTVTRAWPAGEMQFAAKQFG